MDSKLVSSAKSNLEVASNIWTKPDGQDASPWAALEYVPGDWRVKLQGGSEDKRVIERTLNKRQMREYRAYKFFLTFGVDTDLQSKSRHVVIKAKSS
jgi:hypothetical protein